MLKLLLFAALCVLGYRLVRSLEADVPVAGLKGRQEGPPERSDVVDADYVDVDPPQRDSS